MDERTDQLVRTLEEIGGQGAMIHTMAWTQIGKLMRDAADAIKSQGSKLDEINREKVQLSVALGKELADGDELRSRLHKLEQDNFAYAQGYLDRDLQITELRSRLGEWEKWCEEVLYELSGSCSDPPPRQSGEPWFNPFTPSPEVAAAMDQAERDGTYTAKIEITAVETSLLKSGEPSGK